MSELVALYSFLASIAFDPESVTLWGWPVTITAADLAYPTLALVGVCLGVVILLLVFRERVAVGEVLETGLREFGAMFGLMVSSEVVVQAAVQHDGVRWIANYEDDGRVDIQHQECPYCALRLETAHIPKVAAGGTVEGGALPEAEDVTLSGSRLTSVFRYPTEADAESENLVEARACPQCSFAVQGTEETHDGKQEVRSIVERHGAQMEQGAEDPLSQWRHRARERIGRRPSPRDLWDEYVLESSNEAVQFVNIHEDEAAEVAVSYTYPALDELRNDTHSVDRLIAATPEPVDVLIARLSRSTYIDDRKELLARRQAVRNRLLTELTDLEKQVGTEVEYTFAVTTRRADVDRTDVRTAVEHARTELEVLHSDLPDEFLTNGEQRRLSELRARLVEAIEYLERVKEYRAFRDRVDPTIGDFESLYEPYRDQNQYMTSRDYDQLKPLSELIYSDISGFLQDVQPSGLSASAEQWLLETRDRFDTLRDHVEHYNEGGEDRDGFVQAQFDEHDGVLQSDYGALNEKQKLAVVRNDYRNIVDASAGTGKTLTLTSRYEYLYRRGVSTDSILVLTFMREATTKLEHELLSNVDGVNDERQLEVHTFHSFADEVAEPAIQADLPRSWTTREQAIRTEFVDGFCDATAHVQETYPDAFEQFETHAREYESITGTTPGRSDLRTFLEQCRNFDQTADDIVRQLSGTNLRAYHFGMAAAGLLTAYRQRSRDTAVPIDHLDRLDSARRIIKDNPDAFSDRFDHILVDEFQDVAEPSVRLVESLLDANEDTHLFVVGDDWQSINGFKGSNPAFFRGFEDRFESVTRTTLERNYRCPPAVVDASHELIVDDLHTDKPVEADSSNATRPQLYRIDGLYKTMMPEAVVGLVEEKLDGEGLDPEDILVLTRNISSNSYINDVKTKLQANGLQVSSSLNRRGVTIQSIHSSKGKDEKCVILVHFSDDEIHGLPSKERSNELIDPAKTSSVSTFHEEKRLAYVALTRTEEELHIYTKHGNESPFVDDIEPYCEAHVVSGPDTFRGVVASLRTEDGNRLKGTIDCDEPDLTLHFVCLKWEVGRDTFETLESRLEPGTRCLIEDATDVTHNQFPDDIKLTDETVVTVEETPDESAVPERN